ncbi:hypothetical protein [uncultured Winogradskyella sp.]|uniref:hypothetical protein n=1 Tax=uncultured Winogradskyella sp. TaxID=395353 RepID=UPI00261E2230|nr:hypothetical protein [uncultured Winogradskyella sp.]
MSFNLIDRVLYLNKRGNPEPMKQVWQWIVKNEVEPANKFISDSETYYWKIISSQQFNSLIGEENTDWVLIFTKNKTFKALGKYILYSENLIGNKNHPKIHTLWIFNSNFEGLEVSKQPLFICSPHNFKSTTRTIDHDFQLLISKLKNPKIKLTEFIIDPKSKERYKRIR